MGYDPNQFQQAQYDPSAMYAAPQGWYQPQPAAPAYRMQMTSGGMWSSKRVAAYRYSVVLRLFLCWVVYSPFFTSPVLRGGAYVRECEAISPYPQAKGSSGQIGKQVLGRAREEGLSHLAVLHLELFERVC